jgi:hypothetical protein
MHRHHILLPLPWNSNDEACLETLGQPPSHHSPSSAQESSRNRFRTASDSSFRDLFARSRATAASPQRHKPRLSQRHTTDATTLTIKAPFSWKARRRDKFDALDLFLSSSRSISVRTHDVAGFRKLPAAWQPCPSSSRLPNVAVVWRRF